MYARVGWGCSGQRESAGDGERPDPLNSVGLEDPRHGTPLSGRARLKEHPRPCHLSCLGVRDMQLAGATLRWGCGQQTLLSLSLSPVSTATASRVGSLMEQGWDPVCSLEFGRCVHLSTNYIGKDAVKNRYLAKCTTV